MYRLNAKIQRNDKPALWAWLLAIASPFLLLLVLSLILGQNALNAQPVWTDETAFWRALYSLKEAGLNTGCNGMFEEVATVGTLGTSGIGPILIYGGFVLLFGLSNSTIMLCNAVWISMGMAVFCFLRKPPAVVSILLTLLTLLFPPLIMYSLTSMTELFNYALMLFYLAFLMNYIDLRRPGWLIAVCLTLMLGCLYRPMYCVLFVPVVVAFARGNTGKTILAALAAIALSLGCGIAGLLSAAPTTQGFLYHLLHAPDAGTFIRMLMSNTKADLLDYFAHAPGGVAQFSFRIFYLVMLALAGCGIWVNMRYEEGRLRLQKEFSLHMTCVFLMLGFAFALVIMLYETNDWRDYRRLAPFLWLALLYPLARGRFDLPVISLAGCTVLVALMLLSPAEGVFVDENRFTPVEISPELQEVAQVIQYDEGAEALYDNTVRVDLTSMSVMQALDPRLGLQTGWLSTESTGKCRWILTDYLKCPVNGYERVLEVEGYNVYRRIAE